MEQKPCIRSQLANLRCQVDSSTYTLEKSITPRKRLLLADIRSLMRIALAGATRPPTLLSEKTFPREHTARRVTRTATDADGATSQKRRRSSCTSSSGRETSEAEKAPSLESSRTSCARSHSAETSSSGCDIEGNVS